MNAWWVTLLLLLAVVVVFLAILAQPVRIWP